VRFVIHVVGYVWCGHTLRCLLHFEALGFKTFFVDLSKTKFQKDEKYKPNLKIPQVYVDGEYIGGFEELRERFPL